MKTISLLALALLLGSAALLPNIFLRSTLAHRGHISKAGESRRHVRLMKVPDAAKLREQAHGKILVINFWATWCHGCVDEFPEFVTFDKKYRNKSVRIVGISLDQPSDIESKVTPFIKKSGAQFEIRVPDMEDPQPIIDQFTREWTGAMPVTLIFDQRGTLVYKHYGVIDNKEVVSELERLIKA